MMGDLNKCDTTFDSCHLAQGANVMRILSKIRIYVLIPQLDDLNSDSVSGMGLLTNISATFITAGSPLGLLSSAFLLIKF